MIKMYDNTAGYVVADFDGKRMLLDTGAAKTFYDEYQGVRIQDLSRMLGQPLDGVLGMDSLQGRVLTLTRETIHLNGVQPDREGAPLNNPASNQVQSRTPHRRTAREENY